MASLDQRVTCGVGAVLIRHFPDGPRVLLSKRISDKHGKNQFSFPGGKPDPGEDPATANARELLEETGMRAIHQEPISFWTYERYEEERVHFVTLYFLVTSTDEPVNLEPHKHSDWHWFPVGDLPRPLFAGVEAIIDFLWREDPERFLCPA